MSKDLPLGKITSSGFKKMVFPLTGAKRETVIKGPKFGVDTAVIDIGNGMALATSSDPLSLIPSMGLKKSAWLSVQLLANDMATTGFKPQYAQYVLNLPASMSNADFEEYWKYIHEFSEHLGIAITGGHTCKIEGQQSTISGGGTMFLTAPKDEILTSDGVQEGDAIIVTKSAAFSSSAILAASFPNKVGDLLGPEIQKLAADQFYKTSVVEEAILTRELLIPNVELHAMHDVTEGGVVGGLMEVAEACGIGFDIKDKLIPLGTTQKAITELFGIDHRFSLGTGAMLIMVKQEKAESLVQHLAKHKIDAKQIGNFSKAGEACRIKKGQTWSNVTFNGIDPYWEAYFKALENGWN